MERWSHTSDLNNVNVDEEATPAAFPTHLSITNSLTLPAVLYITNMVLFGLAVSHLLKELGAVVKLFSTAASSCLVVVWSTLLHVRIGRNGIRTMAFAAVAIFTSLFIFVSEGERVSAATYQRTKDRHKMISPR
eukprot:m.62907 g.62907  ORF g.62907 m.62907 type:complete len:134 (-) comp8120_c0_seq2:1738-2139(-)